MRLSFALTALGLAAGGVSGAAITSTTIKTVTATTKSTSFVDVTKFVTSTARTTTVVTSTKVMTSTQKVTPAPVTTTVSAAPSTIIITQAPSTVYLTSTETDTTTSTVTQDPSTIYVTSTETDSTTFTVTQDPSTLYLTSTVTATTTQIVTEYDPTTVLMVSTATTTQTSPTTIVQTSTVTVTPSASPSSLSAGSSSSSDISSPTLSGSSISSFTSSTGPGSSGSATSSSTSNPGSTTSSSSSFSGTSSTVSSSITTAPASVSGANSPASTEWTATKTASVYAAQATMQPSSPTSNVEGLSFDRFVIIWLENTDFASAATDPNLAYLATLGITLEEMYGVTHPSQPNYVASHGGDYFGMDNDNLNFVAGNVSTVFDLLDTRGISWGEYQEGMPYAGFEGKAWINQTTGSNNYVRKHNPGVIFNSASESTQRLSQMKNFSSFYSDLENETLPQWMFITPNMLNDGHDTSVTYAGEWLRGFLDPLLENQYFMENTLILVTFDETENYAIPNRVFGFLLGDAVPTNLVNTTDSNYYNHYSQISTICANWDLPTLGRYDVGANVFSVVAASTGDTLREWTATSTLPAFANMAFNQSYAGPFNTINSSVPYPAPNTNAVYAGRSVLPAVVSTWGSQTGSSFYTTGVQIYDGQHPPPIYTEFYDAG